MTIESPHTPAGSVDLLDPELHARGDAILDAFATLAPVSWTPGRIGRGYWSITGHAELAIAARDPETFSSFSGTRPEVIRPPGSSRPLHNLDPPAHTELRAIAARSFARLDAIPIDDIVDAILATRPTELVTGLAEPIVARVFGAWLELADPAELLALVQHVHEAGAELVGTSPADPEHAARARAAATATAAIARATNQLGIRADLASLFVLAGMPTTIDAIGSAIVDLATHPPVDPSDLLVEELLRRASPIAQFARMTTRATVLGDRPIAAGDQIVLWFLAANHDPRVFADPRALVCDRTPNLHVAFGVGPHRCIGASLGRRILRAVVRRAPRVEILETTRRRSNYLRGFVRIYSKNM